MRLLVLLFYSLFSFAQNVHLHTVAFYNTENLFDALDDEKTWDDDYTPEGKNRWSEMKVDQKINQIASVIAHIGKKESQQPPLIIGLAEIENKNVLNRLIETQALKPFHYGIVHFESPDFRGIDVALLYRKSFFKVVHQTTYPLTYLDSTTGQKRYSRDLLVVAGFLNQHHIHLIVNHWPSRRGGKQKSEVARLEASKIHRQITDSIFKKHPESKLISMGDYNDDPSDKSLSRMSENDLFNGMEKTFKQGIGSLAYRDRWHLFDQLLFSFNWQQNEELYLMKTALFNPLWLQTPKGKYRGYPWRTQHAERQLKGFSDHFPVYAILVEKIEINP